MNATSAAIVIVVLIAIGGFILVQRQAAQQRQLTSEQKIGRGIGDLIGGIVGLATNSGGDGNG